MFIISDRLSRHNRWAYEYTAAFDKQYRPIIWQLAKRGNCESRSSWASQETLLDSIVNNKVRPVAMSRTTLQTRLRKLRELKIITVERRRGKETHTGAFNPGTWSTNYYTLVNPDFVIREGQLSAFEFEHGFEREVEHGFEQGVERGSEHKLVLELEVELEPRTENPPGDGPNTDGVDMAKRRKEEPDLDPYSVQLERDQPTEEPKRETSGMVLAQEFIPQLNQTFKPKAPVNAFAFANTLNGWLKDELVPLSPDEIRAALAQFIKDHRKYRPLAEQFGPSVAFKIRITELMTVVKGRTDAAEEREALASMSPSERAEHAITKWGSWN